MLIHSCFKLDFEHFIFFQFTYPMLVHAKITNTAPMVLHCSQGIRFPVGGNENVKLQLFIRDMF